MTVQFYAGFVSEDRMSRQMILVDGTNHRLGVSKMRTKK